MPTTKKDELQNQQNPPTQQMTVPTQSSTVQQAQNMLQQQLSGRTYQSPWQPKINDMMPQYLNRDKFTYDLNADALYNQLREQYALMGQQAMMDTMGQAAMLTGGYGNSYAQSVGQQAYQGYMQLLSDKVPDLYQLALNQYLSEGEKMQSDIGMMMQQYSIDYGKYRDQIADQDDAYSKLVALMTNYGYMPTKDEMAYAGMSDAQMKAILGIKDGGVGGSGGGVGGTGGNGDPPGDWASGIDTQRDQNGIKGSAWDHTKNNLSNLVRSGKISDAYAYMDKVAGEMNESQYNEAIAILENRK